ncbi:hypothetical protein CFOL_v3_25636 [Cephalotus follicularis]|uniref:Uncharacterized protein n=1 Tax=Cephalotus follicularis TaxID=3775 RepID=A0A1Q3CPJ6_CEPFO|nr:hypothetical protein CFOL_v3_25636 [Cephalotus follicularis]
MVKDEWLQAAITDDTVVVELLVRLKQSQAAQSTKPPSRVPVSHLRWGIRQPRSRSMRCDAVPRMKEGDSTTRCSPTTPLSWSGGGGSSAVSPSATADGGFEDSSRPSSRSSSAAADDRSKGTICTNEITGSINKKTRKKKTFAELKEEETFLLKEKVHLNKELATLQTTFEEQSARNKNLKRMKLDLALHSTKHLSSISEEKPTSSQQDLGDTSSFDLISSTLLVHATDVVHRQSDSCIEKKAVSAQDCFSFLPDLNMMPSEDDSSSETLYGMS